MKTLALDDNHDLFLDEFGNLAFREGQYQKAQDVSTAVKTVRGEYVFDNTIGLPYDLIMGEPVNQSLVQEYVNEEAKRIDGVLGARVILNSLDDRVLDADILVSTEDGIIEGI